VDDDLARKTNNNLWTNLAEDRSDVDTFNVAALFFLHHPGFFPKFKY
jgi:hypothetical protein